jgi:hypothetical protein
MSRISQNHLPLTFTALLLAAMVGCMRFTTSEFTSTSSSNQTHVEIRDLKPQPGSETRLAGTWTSKLDRSNRDSDFVVVDLVERSAGSSSSSGYGWTSKDFDPLLRSADGPVHAVVHREAGTLTFDGTMADGRGSGDVVWEPDGWYLKEMSRLTGETITSRRALELGLIGLEVRYVQQIVDAGCKATTAELVSLKFAGVSSDYVAGFYKAGYTFDANDLRSLRFAGVDPGWAKSFHDAGYNFSADELRSLRFAGVDSDGAARFRAAGYKLSADDLRTLRFSGVPADYAAALAAAGYKFTPDELRSLRFAGVGEDYAVELKKAGYTFSADELRHLRFSGVSTDYASELVVAGKHNLSADELIQLRHRGIDAETIRKLRQ